MFGFIIGFLSLAGLIMVLKGGRRGCGGRGWHGSHEGRGGWRGRRGHHGHHDHHEPGGKSWGRRGMLRMLFERLDTTPGQEKEIAAAVDEFVGKARDLRGESRTTRDDVAKLLRTESLDENVMGELFGRHDEKLRDMQKHFADALGRIHQALDPEQRDRLAELIETGRANGFGGPYHSWV